MRRILPFFLLCLAVPVVGAVRGTVMTSEGRALPGATVTIFALESSEQRDERLRSASAERIPLAFGTTNAQGQFNIDNKKEPVIQVLVEASGYAPASLTVLGEDETEPIPLRPAVLKSGKITADGKPVANALVLWQGRDAWYQARSDGEGIYQVPDPEIWLAATTILHPQFAAYRDKPSGRKRALDYRLSHGIELTGRVIAADGKSPLANARIFVDSVLLGSSGPEGSFKVGRVPDHWREIRAVSGNQIGTRRNDKRGLSIRMQPGVAISGTVRDARTQKPLARAAAVLRSGDPNAEPVSVLSGPTGAYSIPPLPADTYRLVISYPTYSFHLSEISLKPGQSQSRTAALSPRGTVSGIVLTADQRPVAAASITRTISSGVFSTTRPSYSGPDGRFLFRDVETDQQLVLEATKPGLPKGRSVPVKVGAGERKPNVVITLPRGFSLAGTVTGPDGKPLSGVTVRAWEADEEMRWMRRFDPIQESEAVTTDHEGKFTLLLARGKHDLWFAKPGFVRKELRAIEVTPNGAPVEAQLELAVEVSGRLVRPDGSGVTGVNVSSRSSAPSMAMAGGTITGPDGSFALEDLPRGPVILWFDKREDLIDFSRPFEAPARDVVVELPPTGTLVGRVVDKNTKSPVTAFQAGVSRERVTPGMVSVGPPMLKTFHSDDGTFELEVPPGAVELMIIAAGYVRARVPGLQVEQGKVLRDLEVALETGTRIAGKVTTEEGSPIEGAWVVVERVLAAGGAMAMMPDARATTDPSGEYVLEGVEPGDRRIRVGKQGFVSTTKELKIAGTEQRLDLRLSKGRSLQGMVVDESGSPIDEATVSVFSGTQGAGGGRVRTDPQGTFTVEGLGPGRYTIQTSKQGFSRDEIKDVDLATVPQNFRVTLKRGAVIYGRILGLNEKELSRVYVTAFAGRTYARADVDPSGNFRLEGAPVGAVRISAYVELPTGGRSTAAKGLDVKAGGEYQTDLEFRSDVVIQGRVTRTGRPVSAVRVQFIPKGMSLRSNASAMTDSDGHYEVIGLEDGEYDVVVREERTFRPYATTYVVRGSGTFNVEIAGGSIQGRIADAESGEGLVNALISLEKSDDVSGGWLSGQTARSDPGGNFALDSVSPGTYRIRVEREPYAPYSADLEIADGESERLDVKLQKHPPVTVRVIDPRDGRNLGATVRITDSANRMVFEGNTYASTDGKLRIPLAAGTYRAIIGSYRYATRILQITSPSGELQVALTPGGSLSIRSAFEGVLKATLLLPSGEAYLTELWNRSADFPLLRGETLRENIAPGMYMLRVFDERGELRKAVPVTVTEGQITRIEVD